MEGGDRLQNLNMRNRARLILEIAQEIGVKVPVIVDPHAAVEWEIAEPCVHTFTNGVYVYSDCSVGFSSDCIPTCFVSNGIVCSMSPWEGILIFKGARSLSDSRFGTSFGGAMDVFPTSTVRLYGVDINIARAQGMLFFSILFLLFVHLTLDFFSVDVGLVVQQSTCDKHSFWDDENTTGKKSPRRIAATAAKTHAEAGAAEESEFALGDGFCGVDDEDLFQIALESYRNAKRAALQQPKGGGGRHEKLTDADTMSYISMNDHVVMHKLQKLGWDQRNGYVNLLPLCVYTNGV